MDIISAKITNFSIYVSDLNIKCFLSFSYFNMSHEVNKTPKNVIETPAVSCRCPPRPSRTRRCSRGWACSGRSSLRSTTFSTWSGSTPSSSTTPGKDYIYGGAAKNIQQFYRRHKWKPLKLSTYKCLKCNVSCRGNDSKKGTFCRDIHVVRSSGRCLRK